MSHFELEPLILELAARFKKYEMREHLRLLRGYYASRKQRNRAAALAKKVPMWTEDMVLSWLTLFRIPPFHEQLKQLPRGAPCPCARADGTSGADSFTATVFPEGRVWRCRACGQSWLVVDAP